MPTKKTKNPRGGDLEKKRKKERQKNRRKALNRKEERSAARGEDDAPETKERKISSSGAPIPCGHGGRGASTQDGGRPGGALRLAKDRARICDTSTTRWRAAVLICSRRRWWVCG